MHDSLKQRLDKLSNRAIKAAEAIETEEATKNALIMPFIDDILGFDTRDWEQVVPEYVADVGVKKGEKVDYALMKDGQPAILMECKKAKQRLGRTQVNQLFRYFASTPARLGILTNGTEYQLYTDLNADGQMDTTPFLEFDITNPDSVNVDTLALLARNNLDVDKVVARARSMVNDYQAVRELIESELKNPSIQFVHCVMDLLGAKPKNREMVERYENAILEAFPEYAARPETEPKPKPKPKNLGRRKYSLEAQRYCESRFSTGVETKELAAEVLQLFGEKVPTGSISTWKSDWKKNL